MSDIRKVGVIIFDSGNPGVGVYAKKYILKAGSIASPKDREDYIRYVAIEVANALAESLGKTLAETAFGPDPVELTLAYEIDNPLERKGNATQQQAHSGPAGSEGRGRAGAGG